MRSFFFFHLFLFCSGIELFSQCISPVNFQKQKDVPSAIPLFQHYLTVRRDTAVSRPYLYAAAKEGGLIIYNISSLSTPLQLATIPTSSLAGLDVNSLVQGGNYLYLALGDIFNSSSQKSGMAIVDVSNPATPLIKSVYTYTANSGAGGVAIDGNTAYLAAMQNGVIVLDVANKSNIQLVSVKKPSVHFPVANPSSSDLLKINARSLVVKNGLIYLCYDAGGVRVLNAANKNNLVETGRYCNSQLNSRPRAYNNLVLNDTLVYVAADYCGMEVLNVKDTAHIKQTGWWNPWNCQSTANTWFNSPGHTNEIEYDPVCKLVFMSAGRSDLMAVSVANPALPDSCSQFGLKKDSVGTWGLGRYGNQIYLAYLSTWPLFTPFRSEWSGIKILTYNNSCVTGLSKFALDGGLNVYPNPAAEKLTIEGIATTNGSLRIYSLTGALICEREFESGTQHWQLDTGGIARGVYILRISDRNSTKSMRLLLSGL